MRHSTVSNLKIAYLREYEFIFKTALAHESGDPGILFAEKTRGSKISWDCPINAWHCLYMQGQFAWNSRASKKSLLNCLFFAQNEMYETLLPTPPSRCPYQALCKMSCGTVHSIAQQLQEKPTPLLAIATFETLELSPLLCGDGFFCPIIFGSAHGIRGVLDSMNECTVCSYL
jgi:hypothetical protein